MNVCTRAAEVQKAMSPEALRMFTKHAHGCEDCKRLLDQVANAYAVLRADEIPLLSPAKRVELLASIEGSQPRSWRLPAFGFAATVMACVVIAVLAWPSAPKIVVGGTPYVKAGRHVPLGESQNFDGGSVIEYRNISVEALAESTLSFDWDGDTTLLKLDDGSIRIDLSRPEPKVVVRGVFATIQVVTARHLTVTVDLEKLEMEAKGGTVRVDVDGEIREVTGRLVLSNPHFVKAATALAEAEVVEPEEVEPAPITPPSITPPPAPRKTQPKVARSPAKQRLEEAQSVVRKEPKRARALAEGVLEEKTTPEIEIGALLVLADAKRRTGEWAGAAEAYERVAQHAGGGPYAEEALFRRAKILERHGRTEDALAALKAATARFPAGSLLPERTVLEAKLLLAKGDVDGAGRVIDRVRGDQTLSVQRMRERIEAAR